MIGVIRRHEIRALRGAGQPIAEVARLTGVSLRTVQRISKEPDIASYDDAAERRRRSIGRPSVVRKFRALIVDSLVEVPHRASVDLLRTARVHGYSGGKSALYGLVASVRSELRKANAGPDPPGAG